MADDQQGDGDGADRAAVPELQMAVELLLLTPLLPACVVLYLNYVQAKWAQVSWATAAAASWIEFLVVAGSLVIQMTPGARSREIGVIWGVLGIIFIGLDSLTSHRLEPDQHDAHKVNVIALYYGSIVLGTTLAILAIDFPVVFPLEWRKTEEFGLSVMDLGVGLFVFALGVKGATRKDAKKHLSQAAVLSLIGIIRSVLVSLGVIGQDPTEYGLNWNFFFTLAALILLQTILGALDSFAISRIKFSGGTLDARGTTVFSVPVSLSLAVVILIATQASLSLFEGLLLTEPSDRLLEIQAVSSIARFCLLNAEGMIQIPGLFALVLLADVAVRIIGIDQKENLAKLGAKTCRSGMLCLLSLVAWFVSTTVVQKTCRRMANSSYIMWMLAYNLALISAWLFVCRGLAHSLMKKRGELSLFKFSKTALPTFLFGNLATGGVNLLLERITLMSPSDRVEGKMSPHLARGVLVVYLGSVWLCSHYFRERQRKAYNNR